MKAVEPTATEALLRRDRAIVVAGLALITIFAWCYVVSGAGTGMSAITMSRLAVSPGAFTATTMDMPVEWTATYWLIMTLMWWIMMVAMMVPSAAPMILLYARMTRHAHQNALPPAGVAPTSSFAGGYLIAWLGFSVLAATLQFSLAQASLISPMLMWSLSPWLSVTVLLGAGIYQLTPVKHVCLDRCRMPAQFLSRYWRPGHMGAIRMGFLHGTFCVACCWALMALLFVGGIMNLLWIAGLAVFVLIEKLVQRGRWLSRAGGVVAIAAAIWIGVRAVGLA